ncbi:MAG: ribosome recycling factor, partial [Myxococcota bacterium]
KVSVRNARRDARDMVDAIDNLPEDDSKRAKDSVQALTDDFVGKVDAMAAAKETDILEV